MWVWCGFRCAQAWPCQASHAGEFELMPMRDGHSTRVDDVLYWDWNGFGFWSRSDIDIFLAVKEQAAGNQIAKEIYKRLAQLEGNDICCVKTPNTVTFARARAQSDFLTSSAADSSILIPRRSTNSVISFAVNVCKFCLMVCRIKRKGSHEEKLDSLVAGGGNPNDGSSTSNMTSSSHSQRSGTTHLHIGERRLVIYFEVIG